MSSTYKNDYLHIHCIYILIYVKVFEHVFILKYCEVFLCIQLHFSLRLLRYLMFLREEARMFARASSLNVSVCENAMAYFQN